MPPRLCESHRDIIGVKVLLAADKEEEKLTHIVHKLWRQHYVQELLTLGAKDEIIRHLTGPSNDCSIVYEH